MDHAASSTGEPWAPRSASWWGITCPSLGIPATLLDAHLTPLQQSPCFLLNSVVIKVPFQRRLHQETRKDVCPPPSSLRVCGTFRN